MKRPRTLLGITMEAETRWNFLSDAINAALFGGFIGVVGPFTLPLAVRLGASPLQIGLITAAPFMANLLSPLWADWSQNARKVPWVVIPNFLWRGGMGLIGLIKNPALLTTVYVGTHTAGAAANPAYGTLIQKVYPPRIRGRLMGYVRLAMAGVMLPATLVAGRVMDRFGPSAIYLVAGFLGIAGIGVYALTKEPAVPAREEAPLAPGESTPAEAQAQQEVQAGQEVQSQAPAARIGPMAGLRMAFADAPFRRFLVASLLFHGGVLVASPLYAVAQVKQMGLGNTQIGYLSIAWNLAWLLAFAVWGRVIDRQGPRPVVIGAAAFYLGLPLAYALGGGTFAFLILGHMAQGIADAAMDLGSWNLILAGRPDRVGPYTAASMTVTGIRGALGPLLGSVAMGVLGFRTTFLSAAALVLAGLVLFVSGRLIPPGGWPVRRVRPIR